MRQETRTNQFIKNIIGSAFLQIVTVITGFISPKLMLSAFGSEINGITSSIMQFVSYIALVEAGLANATVFALYKPLADKDDKARDAVISAAKISYYKIGFLFTGLALVLALIYPFIGKTDVLNYSELVCLVLVICLSSIVNFFVLAKYRAILTADQCGYLISISSAAQLICHLAIMYLCIQLDLHIVLVRGLALLSMGVTTLILTLCLRHRYGKINFNAEPNMKALDKRWDAMFNQVLGVIHSSSPVVLMTAMLDFKQISVYTVYNMISGSISNCISIFTSGLSSGFGNIYAKNDSKLLQKTTAQFRTAYYTLITAVYTTMIMMLLPFIKLYTDGITDANYIVPLFGVLLTLSGMLDNLAAPFGMLVFSSGKFRIIRRMNVVKTVLLVLGCFAGIKLYGLVGIPATLCVVNLYGLVEFLVLAKKHLVEYSLGKVLIQIVRCVLTVLLGYFVSARICFVISGYMQWALYALIVFFAAALISVLLAFVFDFKEMKEILNRIQTLVKSKK